MSTGLVGGVIHFGVEPAGDHYSILGLTVLQLVVVQST